MVYFIVHIAKEDKESKLSPRTIKCIFVGYDHQSKVYRCFNPIARKNLITKDIHFNENMLNPTNKIKIDGLDHVDNIAIQSFGSFSWISSPSSHISINTKIQARIHTHPIDISPNHDATIIDSSFEDKPMSHLQMLLQLHNSLKMKLFIFYFITITHITPKRGKYDYISD